MPELIDKNAMIAVFEKIASKSLLDDAKIHWYLAIEAVNIQPTIEAEPIRHGRWIPHRITYSSMCSVCTKYATAETPRCPYCGAYLRGGAENG